MHKKGITEEVAKKRSRKTVKHQRGIVGADLAFIAARRNQTDTVRREQRLAAIAKAKSEKRGKETVKAKVRVYYDFYTLDLALILQPAPTRTRDSPQGIEAANEGWQGWTMITTTCTSSLLSIANRALDIVVQLHSFVVSKSTFTQCHSTTPGGYKCHVIVSFIG